MSLLTAPLTACVRDRMPSVASLEEVVRSVPGVTEVTLSVRDTGGAGRLLEGEVGLPDDPAQAREVFDAALRALSAELGGEPLRLAVYVEGRSGAETLTTADVGAPLNPTSVGLWRHYHG